MAIRKAKSIKSIEEALKMPSQGVLSPPLETPYVKAYISELDIAVERLTYLLEDVIPLLSGEFGDGTEEEDITTLKILLHKAIEIFGKRRKAGMKVIAGGKK